jgi:hypothetical protein
VKVLLKWNADLELTDFADIVPRDKTKSPMIRGLIDRRITSIHGGDATNASQSVNWMSFGVGLGKKRLLDHSFLDNNVLFSLLFRCWYWCSISKISTTSK